MRTDEQRAVERKRYWEKHEESVAKIRRMYKKHRLNRNAECRAYKKTNSEDIAAYMKRYRAEHVEKVRDKHKQWLAANKHRKPDYDRAYRERHAERLLAKRQTEKHRADVRRWANTRYATNLHHNIKVRLGRTLNQAIIRYGNGKKSASITKLIGCTIEQLVNHLEKQFVSGMTWENRRLWEIDHIRPCVSFDLRDPEQQRVCFHFSNLQPLWRSANRQKGGKWNPTEGRAQCQQENQISMQ